MKYYLFIYFLLSLSYCYSQNEYYEIVKPRKEFKIVNDTTLIIPISGNNNFDILCEYIDDKNLIKKYKRKVFRYTNKNSNTIFYIKQWNTPIFVYLDERIPKQQSKKLIDFFQQLNEINNLTIKHTNKKEKANYYIKVIDNIKHGYNEDYEFEDEEERRTHPLTNTTYNLLNDKILKLYCGILTINSNEFNDPDLALKKIKQLFYMSLANFSINYFGDSRSLLSDRYTNSDSIVESDLDLLKIHYSILYNQKINSNQFDDILKLANSKCND